MMLTLFVITLTLFILLLLSAVDKFRIHYFNNTKHKVSFIVPCYNSSKTVDKTIKSIFKSANFLHLTFEILTIDDASNDSTLKVLRSLQKKYHLHVFHNNQNIGKTLSLNKYSSHAKYPILAFIDSDVILTEKVLLDSLSRFQQKNVKAVTSNLIPLHSDEFNSFFSNKKGSKRRKTLFNLNNFLVFMQKVEYNMTYLFQSPYNIKSSLAMWGACIFIKKRTFNKVGKFSLNAVAEDKDLAFKINREGFTVQISSFRAYTLVPETIESWIKQKTRWAVGSVQCLLEYPKVWLRNPIFLLSLSFIIFFLVAIIPSIVIQLSVLYYLIKSAPFLITTYFKILLRSNVLSSLFNLILFSMFSLPYVYPLVESEQRVSYVFLVFPFSIIYLPLFSLISVVAVILSLNKIRRLIHAVERAW